MEIKGDSPENAKDLSPKVENGHTLEEIRNITTTRSVLDEWVRRPFIPSGLAIPVLHKSLLQNVEEYQSRGYYPHEPGTFRETDIHIDTAVSKDPENIFVRGTDITPLMREYTRELDRRLAKQNERRSTEDESIPPSPHGHIAETVQDAAWAYYCWIRIHPFFDGNGRTGRFVLNRVLQGGGLESIIYGGDWYDSGARDKHLDTMRQVDGLGDTTPLEIHLLEGLKVMYESKEQDGDNQRIVSEIEEAITKKGQKQIAGNKDLGDVWDKFRPIDISQKINREPTPAGETKLIA